MSSFSHPQETFLENEIEPRTSIMAVFSIVCSLICCIPILTGLLGAFLGVVALFLIGSSHGRLKGRGLAFGGVVLGLLTSMLWIGVFIGMTRTFGGYSNGTTATFEAIAAGDIVESRSRFLPSLDGAVSDEQILVFGQMMRDDFGEFVTGPKSLAEYMTAVSKTGHTGFTMEYVPNGMTYEKDIVLVFVRMPDANSRPDQQGQFIRDLGYRRSDGSVVWLSEIGPVDTPAIADPPSDPDEGDGGGEGSDESGGDG